MPFVKTVKNKAYFKRYQVKYRRRREGKTDFFARRRLVSQEKCKYNSPKYRLIVRITNSRVICQVANATMTGDKVLDSCDSSELPRFGVPVGLTNYPAAYCTGLLMARRVLTKIGMADSFSGHDGEPGDEYHVEESEEGERRPFKALLDVGLRRTTTGARVFAALKGAADGGLHVPHSVGRFPGFTKAEEKGDDSKYDAEAHKMRIYGAHIAEYMDKLEEEDQTKYERQFSLFHKNGIDSEKLESMYKSCHAAIRKDPSREKKEKKEIKHRVAGNVVHDETNSKSWKRARKISLKQKRDRVKQKIQAAIKKQMAAAE